MHSDERGLKSNIFSRNEVYRIHSESWERMLKIGKEKELERS